MTKSFASILFPVLMLAICALSAAAQDRQKYVISARAGTVNSVQGPVSVRRLSTGQVQVLASTDDLNSGDVVQTGSNGRVEVLLSPGSYLRVNENSEFELSNSSLDALRIKLVKGSSIIEATGPSEADVNIGIDTPVSALTVVKRGIYRINIPTEKRVEVLVRKGKVLVARGRQIAVDAGHELVLEDGSADVAKLDKQAQDEFDSWSRERAKMLSAANRSLTDSAHSELLASSTLTGVHREFLYNPSWGLYDQYAAYYSNYGYSNYGLWFFDPFLSCFTFTPFYSGWGSPYGYSYYNNFYGLPWTRYYFRRGVYPPIVPPYRRSAVSGRAATSIPNSASGSGQVRRVYRPEVNVHQRTSQIVRQPGSSMPRSSSGSSVGSRSVSRHR